MSKGSEALGNSGGDTGLVVGFRLDWKSTGWVVPKEPVNILGFVGHIGTLPHALLVSPCVFTTPLKCKTHSWFADHMKTKTSEGPPKGMAVLKKGRITSSGEGVGKCP